MQEIMIQPNVLAPVSGLDPRAGQAQNTRQIQNAGAAKAIANTAKANTQSAKIADSAKPADLVQNGFNYSTKEARALGLDYGALSSDKNQDRVNRQAYEILSQDENALENVFDLVAKTTQYKKIQSDDNYPLSGKYLTQWLKTKGLGASAHGDEFWEAYFGVGYRDKMRQMTQAEIWYVDAQIFDKFINDEEFAKKVRELQDENQTSKNLTNDYDKAVADKTKNIADMDKYHQGTFDYITGTMKYDKTLGDKLAADRLAARQEFKARYLFSDEFAKTQEFERLFGEYYARHLKYSYANASAGDLADPKEKLKDLVVRTGFKKQDWLKFFDFQISEANRAIASDTYTKAGVAFFKQKINYFNDLKSRFMNEVQAVDERA